MAWLVPCLLWSLAVIAIAALAFVVWLIWMDRTWGD
jgi:hypothetical protein